MTDWQLLQRFADEGAHDAFDELVRRYVNLVYSTALRRVRSADLAEDVTQATFIVLARKAGTIRHAGALSSWLYKTARFAAIDALRRQSARHRHEQKAAAMRPEHHTPDHDPSASWDEISPHLEAALDRLPRRDREAIVLRFYEDRTFEQIAQVQGITASTAHHRVHKALARLQSLLKVRGVVTASAAGLGSLIAANAVGAAPVGVAAGATSLALATGSLSAAVAGSSSIGIAKGTLTAMTIAKLQTAAAVTVVAAASVGFTGVAVQQAIVNLAPAAPAPAPQQPAAVDQSAVWAAQQLQFEWRSLQTSASITKPDGDTAELRDYRRIDVGYNVTVPDEPGIVAISQTEWAATAIDESGRDLGKEPSRNTSHYWRLDMHGQSQQVPRWQFTHNRNLSIQVEGPAPQRLQQLDGRLRVLVGQTHETVVPLAASDEPVALTPQGTLRIAQAGLQQNGEHYDLAFEIADLGTDWHGWVHDNASSPEQTLPNAILTAAYLVFPDGTRRRLDLGGGWYSSSFDNRLYLPGWTRESPRHPRAPAVVPPAGGAMPVSLIAVVATDLREVDVPFAFADLDLPRFDEADGPAVIPAGPPSPEQAMVDRFVRAADRLRMAGATPDQLDPVREQFSQRLESWRNPDQPIEAQPIAGLTPDVDAYTDYLGTYTMRHGNNAMTFTVERNEAGRFVGVNLPQNETIPLIPHHGALLVVPSEIVIPQDARLAGETRYELASYALIRAAGTWQLVNLNHAGERYTMDKAPAPANDQPE